MSDQLTSNGDRTITNTITNTKVKVCGMTRTEEVRAAVDLGVDAIGVILHADSPRQISTQVARDIRAEIPAFITMVGVFVDCESSQINKIISETDIDLVQLHGSESNELGLSLDKPFIKAIRARSNAFVTDAVSQYADAKALLLDPYVKGQHGGTGKQLSTELWPTNTNQKLILAGGLSPHNLFDSVTQLRPFAVDLNSGVETSPGHKSIELIGQAMQVLGRCN